MKKVFLVLSLIFILSLSAIAEGINYDNLSPDELRTIIQEATTALEKKEASSEYPRLSVDELFSAYSQNAAAADLKYTDQLVEIKDNVNRIDKNGSNKYEIVLGDGGLFSNSISCYMKEDQLAKIAEIEKDRDVIIRGICKGDPSWSIILFYDCEIVD